jgi:ubiquitin-activating enzyme E1
VEIAKNILLLGPAHLALKDDLLVRPTDLTSNLFLKESHVGKETRARASFPILNKINPQVQLTIQEGDLTEDYVKNFDLIIFTKYYPLKDLISLNKFCRNQKKPIGFVLCQAFGLHAYCFIDYGEGFKIYDKDGEEPKPFLISDITKASPGVVTLIKEKPHNYSDGDFVRIYEVEGMTEVNGTDTRPIRILSPYSFTIEDTKEFSQYVRGGFVEIAKVPFRINFRSLEERMLRPFDEKKEVSPRKKLLHLGYLALMEYGNKYGTFPELNNKQQAQIMVDMAHEILDRHKKMVENGRKDVLEFTIMDEEYIRNLGLFAKCQVTPFCAFWAGIISLELVKFTGKFIPLQDFYHFDSFECLPSGENIDREPSGSRYDDQVIIFGKDTQEFLQRMK